MVKDGEDWHGLQTTNLKKQSLNFLRYANRYVTPVSCFYNWQLEQFLQVNLRRKIYIKIMFLFA